MVTLLAGQGVYAAVLLLVGSTASWTILLGLLLIGACWMAIMTTLNATAQVYLPRKFRARGMAAYLMAFALGMALGSAGWGWLAAVLDLSIAFQAAAVLMLLTALAMHPLPIGTLHVESEGG